MGESSSGNDLQYIRYSAKDVLASLEAKIDCSLAEQNAHMARIEGRLDELSHAMHNGMGMRPTRSELLVTIGMLVGVIGAVVALVGLPS